MKQEGCMEYPINELLVVGVGVGADVDVDVDG